MFFQEYVMNYLIVVAHPDDEVLGAGATIHKISRDNRVDVCILSSDAKARIQAERSGFFAYRKKYTLKKPCRSNCRDSE